MTVRSYNTLVRMITEAAHQRIRADKIAATAKPLAEEISRVEKHLATMRAELARQQGDMEALTQEAEDLRDLVEQACKDNGWDVPEPPAELNLRDTESFPVADQPPAAEQVRAVQRVSEACMQGECPCTVAGCPHECHWLSADVVAKVGADPQPVAPASDTRPDVPENAEVSADARLSLAGSAWFWAYCRWLAGRAWVRNQFLERERPPRGRHERRPVPSGAVREVAV